jgi:DNA-binding CsgD family transcriptional regulator/tetratricopeptide (TPR) repeat protein
MGLFAFDEAAHWYRRAAEVVAQGSGGPPELDLATVLLRAAEAEASAGNEPTADRDFARAIAAIDRTTSFARWYLASVRRVTWLWSGGHERASLALADELRSVRIPHEARQPAAVLAARSRILMWSLDDRDFDEPERLARIAIDRSRLEGDPQAEAIARICLGNVLFNTGRVDAGVDEFRQGASAALRARAYRELRSAASMLMAALGESERREEAMAAGDALLVEVDAIGVRPSVRHSMFGNWVEAALWLGRWDEAVTWIGAALAAAVPAQEAASLVRSRAAILVARGDLPGAMHDVATAERLAPSMLQSQQVGGLAAVRAEAAHWQGRYEAASEAVRVGLERSEATKAEDIYHDLVLLGLRIEADLVAVERRGVGKGGASASRDRTARLIRILRHRRATRDPRLTLYSGQIAVASIQARAEVERVQGRTSPVRWRGASEGWARLRRPYAEAYARFRLGEALLRSTDPDAGIHAREALGQALRLTMDLGARPLREAVETVLAQAGIDPASLPSVTRDLDRMALTTRERDVLRRLTAGRSNKEIGTDLGISEKTAEIHVSNVLRKLGVTNRVEAATKGVELGLRTASVVRAGGEVG